MLAWRTTAFVNCTHRIGFRMSEFFCKIDENFGGFISWKTQTELSCTRWTAHNRSVVLVTCVTANNGLPRSIMQLILLQHGYWTFVIILFGPFARLFFNLATCKEELLSQICIHSWSCRASILEGEGATFHRMNRCKFLRGNHCRAIETFYHWDLPLGLLVLDAFFHSAAWKNSEKDLMVNFFHAYWYRGGNCNCLL